MDTEVVEPNTHREITKLCDGISSSVYIINSRIKNLKSVVDNIGTAKDNQQLRNQIQAWQQEVNEKIKTSSEDVNKLDDWARMANKQQKLQIYKITNHCKDAMEGYCKIQEEVVQKLRSNLVSPMDSSSNWNDDSSSFIDQEQIQIQRNLEIENQLLLERQQSVKQIESDILKLNGTMKKMGELIHEQGTAVETIENRLESAYEDVRLANQELTTAAHYQTKSRKKKLFLVLILVIVVSVLIGMIAWYSRS